MAGAFRGSAMSVAAVGRWARRRYSLAGLLTFSMVASLLSAVPPQPVTASPAAPAGATAVKPSQRAGVAGLPSHEATTARTSFAGSAGGSAARPPVPGAVGAEQTFPAVKVPGQGEAGQ